MACVFTLTRPLQIYTSLMIGFSDPEHPSLLFDTDWFKIINTLILGLGNGLLGTLLMIMAPYKASQSEAERAG